MDQPTQTTMTYRIKAVETGRDVVKRITLETALEICIDNNFNLTIHGGSGPYSVTNHDGTLSAEDPRSPLKACQDLYNQVLAQQDKE